MTPTQTRTAPALRDKVAARAEGGVDTKPAATILDLIDRLKPAIARALPSGQNAERFTRIVLTEMRRNPALMDCTPQSLLGAIMLSAQLGLEPGPLGHSYFVPFRDGKTGKREVTFILGYKGIIDLARRSGNIVSLVAREVCEHDYFEFEYGLDEKLVHRPALKERGAPVAYYAVAHYVGGGHTIHVMSVADVEKRRSRSKASKNGPWVTDFGPMAMKTCIRAMAPFLPLSIETASAFAADEGVARYREDEPLDITPDEQLDVGAEPAELVDGAASTAAEPPGVEAAAQGEPGGAETPSVADPGSPDLPADESLPMEA